MKINYMSDLHIEFHNLLHELEGDILILAGDINTKANVDWINEAAKFFKHIVYVLGNHEFYHGDLTRTLEKIRKRVADNVNVLQNESVTLENIRFHGTTLWTDVNGVDRLSMDIIHTGMNDFRLIRADNYANRFTPNRSIKEFNIATEFLMNSVKEGDIVVTHHAPHKKSITPQFANDYHMNGAFASDMSKVIKELKPSYWIHGHSHWATSYKVADTEVLCNPRGYPMEYTGFDLNACIII